MLFVTQHGKTVRYWVNTTAGRVPVADEDKAKTGQRLITNLIRKKGDADWRIFPRRVLHGDVDRCIVEWIPPHLLPANANGNAGNANNNGLPWGTSP